MNVNTMPLYEEMRCSILSNPKGDILILHDKLIRSDIQWVEFNTHDLKLSLIHKDGMPQDLGIDIDPVMAMNIKQGNKVQFALLQDKKIVDVKNSTIVIQDY
ncbi:MAG: hypothetical protein GW903_02535 [Alphaproteobacteria bacterium]|nr:hypothetical protein [Alphaproteobacteria bacterium]NCQ87850.1 hypothetical protein [Alphaproteobacteria bacterium]NCT05642.1 hypothetical protein [Alphaproteobacteria bacterium]